MAVAANNDDVTGYKDLKGRTGRGENRLRQGESYAKQHADKYGYKVTSVDQSSTMYEMVKSGNAARGVRRLSGTGIWRYRRTTV